MQEPYWTIGQLADEYSVSFRTLRFYESTGLLKPERRGTLRLFRSEDRIRLELILKGKRLGFTLSEIEELISGPRAQPEAPIEPEKEIVAGLSVKQLEDQIRLLERRRDDLNWAIDELLKARLSKEDVKSSHLKLAM